MKRAIILRILTYIRSRLPVWLTYFGSQIKRAKAKWITLENQLIDDRENRLKYYSKRAKLLIEKFDNHIEQKALTQEWFAWTIDDSEEFISGWSRPIYKYTGQTLPKIKHRIVWFNQLEFKSIGWYVMCWLYWPLWVIADNFPISITKQHRRNLNELWVKDKYFVPWVWNYFSSGIRIIHDYMDKIGVKYKIYTFPTQGKYLRYVLDQWYSVLCGVKISQTLLNWMRKDGILDNHDLSWDVKYFHVVRLKKSQDWKYDLWIDNYEWVQKVNTFTIEELEAITRAGKFQNTSYVTVPLEDEKTDIITDEDKKNLLDYNITLTWHEISKVSEFINRINSWENLYWNDTFSVMSDEDKRLLWIADIINRKDYKMLKNIN